MPKHVAHGSTLTGKPLGGQKTYRIVRSLLPSKFSKLETDDGELDYLGQILVQMGYNVEKCTLPSDLKKPIFPFTVSFRRKVLDSPVTMAILRLDLLPRKQAEEELVEILRPHGITLTFED